MARRCPSKKKVWRKKIKICLAYVTPRLPMSAHKKLQPIRSSSLAGLREHIYECLVLLYRCWIPTCFVSCWQTLLHSGSRKHSGEVAWEDRTSSHCFSGTAGVDSSALDFSSWSWSWSWSCSVPKSGLGLAHVAPIKKTSAKTWKKKICKQEKSLKIKCSQLYAKSYR